MSSAPTAVWPSAGSSLRTGSLGNTAFKPTYRVQVGWEDQASIATPTFSGAYDDITAQAAGIHVDEISITRGREDDLSTVRAGEITVSGRDTLGRFNPRNSSSPLYGSVLPVKPIKVTATYSGVTYPLGLAWTDRIEWQPVGSRGGEFQIHALDMFTRFDNFRPLLSSIGATTTGAAIGRMLDAMGWTDASLRRLAIGDSIPDFFTTQGILNSGTTSMLTLIENLLLAERGIVFIGADGAVVYQSRTQRYTAASAGSLTDVMENLTAAADVAKVTNRWTVVRQDFVDPPNTISTQQASDSTSISLYGYQESSVETPYLNSDTQGLNLAQYLLANTKSPVHPVWDLPFQAWKDGNTLTQGLARDVGDRVMLTPSRSGAGGVGDYFIEQVSHDIHGAGHDVTWRLSERPAGTPFIFGVSQFGSSDYLVY